jgi:hypothetical protein
MSAYDPKPTLLPLVNSPNRRPGSAVIPRIDSSEGVHFGTKRISEARQVRPLNAAKKEKIAKQSTALKNTAVRLVVTQDIDFNSF